MSALARALSAGLLLCCSVAQAQTLVCAAEATVEDCVGELVFEYGRTLRAQAALTPVVDEAAAEEKAEAGAVAAGNEAEASDQAGTATAGGKGSSTITDLVPLLNMAGLLSDSDDSDGTVAIDLNFLVQFWNRDTTKHDSQLKWELELSPVPFEPLVQAIPESVREARSRELQEKIEDKANSRFVYTYSIVSDRLGRDYRRHERSFATLMKPVILGAGGPDAVARYDAVRGQFATRLVRLAIPDMDTTTVGELSDDQLAGLYQLIADARETYSRLIAERLDAISGELDKSRITAMAELVLQQPQFLVSAEKSLRSRIAGPGSQGVKITYEHGFVNLNSFMRFARDRRAGSCQKMSGTQMSLAESRACLDALDAYLDAHAEALESGSRLKLGIEYRQVEEWKYSLVPDGVDLDLPKRDRLVVSLGLGRTLSRSATRDRIDFEVAYDSNLDDDDTNKERFVATLTYTRRFGETDIPFSIVYANKSEFLAGSDRQIGVHFGVKFRALDKD